MVQVLLEDDCWTHPKHLAAGPVAFAVWVRGICYANHHLTNGFIPAEAVPSLVAGCDGEDPVAKLVRLHEWEPVEGGYSIHDYLDYQPSKETVLRQRGAVKARVQKHRNPPPKPSNDVTESVTADLFGEELPKRPPFGADELLAIWNAHCGALRKGSLNVPRRASANARAAEFPDRDRWVRAVQTAAASAFCLGENDRNWVANFEWFVRPNTILGLEEGKYGRKQNGGHERGNGESSDRWRERAAEAEDAARDLQESDRIRRAFRQEHGLSR